MDLQELLSIADQNKAEARREASVKRYSTSLAPAKKLPKSNVQSEAIKQFLARKQAEEQQRVEEARRKRDELLALRAQNSKSNKKAKIMASRTKDNDFSKIKLTDDEVEAKRRREAELLRLALNDKVQRMKARIELEEKEKLLPKKRKRKSKHAAENNQEPQDEVAESDHIDSVPPAKQDRYSSKNDFKPPQNNIKKPRLPPAQPSLSFQELLKLAAQKQHEPVVLPKVKKDDERPLTKKEKRLLAEEESRLRRKIAGQYTSSSSKLNADAEKFKSNSASGKNNKVANVNVAKKHSSESGTIPPVAGKPTVIRVEKQQKTNAVSKSTMNGNSSFNSYGKSFLKKKTENPTESAKPGPSAKYNQNSHNAVNNVKHKELQGNKDHSKKMAKGEKQRPPESSLNRNKPDHCIKKKSIGSKSTETKKQKTEPSSNQPSIGLSQDMLEEIKKQIRDQVQKEFEAKMKQCKPADTVSKSESASSKVQNKQTSQPPFRTSVQKPHPPKIPASLNKSASGTKVNSDQRLMPKEMIARQKQANVKPNGMRKDEIPSSKKVSKPPAPVIKPKKPAFHPNPYLEPPRRLLESQRPQNRMKRRLESDDDDDDEEDEDDMSDFIDDGPLHDEQENYSEYIKEIFGYDRSRYADDDDDDIIETSFAEQMKEETRSTRIGYLEDLEDMKKEQEEQRRKKMKKKLKK